MKPIGVLRKISSCIALVFVLLCHAQSQPTEIRCHINGITEAYLVWGVNDWQVYKKKLPGTFVSDKVMHTAMKKEGEEYVAKLDVDSGNVINYGFMLLKKSGPFGKKAEYWEMNDKEGNRGYNIQSGKKEKAIVTLDINKLKLVGQVPLNSVAMGVILMFGLGALLLFILRRYYSKSPVPADGKAAYFIAVSAALFSALFLIRAYTADLLYAFLLAPLDAFWQMFAASWGDMKYAAILFLFFGLLFLVFKKARRFTLVFYTIVVFLSVVAALANIRVLQLLGRPFNYQWLYYSDFLQSRDASLAMAANVTWPFISGFLLMLLATIVLACFFYQAYLQKKVTVLSLLPLLFIISMLAQFNSTVPPLKAANPVLFFIQSAGSADASPVVDKSYAGKSDFDTKNIDSLPAAYAGLFQQAKIKNVVFLVLESTPWEYVPPYDTLINAMPFLSSYKSKAAFSNIYAHIPATNKSMFSFLCASYPEISFRTLTQENPKYDFPSIPSELKKHGYRTVFFNSGDNGYQNAGSFLKSRGFDKVEDFHNGNCTEVIFKDKRYSKEKLDGVDDSCLSVRLFDWLGKDTAQPFFAMMWTFQTHYPYFVAGTQKNYRTGNPSLEKYLNALHRADETLQQIVAGFRQRNLLEQTLIVVCGDHGEAFGRHGQTAHGSGIYEENIHVPLLFINPRLFKEDKIESFGGISDIAPTIFSMLEKPVPQQWQGENLFSTNRRQRVYFFNPYNDYLFGMREGNFKFIYNATQNTYQLYDLSKDPHEANDISKQNEAYVKEAAGHVHAWMYYQAQQLDNALKMKPDK
jgi:lipoteichoic acid synthase